MFLFGSFRKEKPSPSQPGRWQVGDRIGGVYEICQILGGEGKSGMGVVYICRYSEHGKIYALKTLQEKYLFSECNQKLLEREAIVWTELEKHPFIVHAYWVVWLEGRLFIVLEYISADGRGRNTLTHYLYNLTFPEILKFSIQFCYGMGYIYSKGIDAHRDIKPDNIMIASDKTVKITDFGLVKAFQEIQLKEDIISSGDLPSLSIFQSKGKRICGTLPYMSPEQFDGYTDKRSDIYAFGITLYQMITNGKLPFVGRTQQEYEKLHKYERVPAISSSLFSIIQKCLEKDPNKRYQDFINIREESQQLLLKETGETVIPPKSLAYSPKELVFKGFALNQLNRPAEAISYYDRALNIDPNYRGLRWCKGNALGLLGRLNEAISCYESELNMYPRYVEAWNSKGVVLDSLSRPKEAIACYDKAIEIVPKYADAWYNRGNALFNLGRPQEAIACYDKAIEINPRYDKAVWHNKGVVLFNLGRYQEAISCYDKVIEIIPRDVDAWYNKGAALYNFNRYDEALGCVEEVIKLNPDLPQAHQLKQLILQKLGR